jgi:hypothetical protein
MVISHPALLSLLGAFLVTFLATRLITSRIRAGRTRLSDLAVGTVHLHHVVWGFGLVLVAGTSQFAFMPHWPLSAVPAIGFGTGAALMLDEFALVIYIRDVYWSEEGRRSIDATVVMIVVLGMLVQFLTPGQLPNWRPAFLIALTVAYVVLMAISLAKGKVFTSLAGLFIPYFLIVGALRLGRPNTPWAWMFYRRNPIKQRRAAARFDPHRLHERARGRVLDAIGLSPTLSPRTHSRVTHDLHVSLNEPENA